MIDRLNPILNNIHELENFSYNSTKKPDIPIQKITKDEIHLATQGREYNILHYIGRLFQKILCDIECAAQQQDIQYICSAKLQKKFFRLCPNDEYKLAKSTGSVQSVGRRILPRSFKGGPRQHWHEFQNSMAIVRSQGKPHLFLTLTCNPN